MRADRCRPGRNGQRFALAVPPGHEAPKPVLNVAWRPDRPMHLQLRRLSYC